MHHLHGNGLPSEHLDVYGDRLWLVYSIHCVFIFGVQQWLVL